MDLSLLCMNAECMYSCGNELLALNHIPATRVPPLLHGIHIRVVWSTCVCTIFVAPRRADCRHNLYVGSALCVGSDV